MTNSKLWVSLILVMVLSFLVLGYFGYDLYHKAPPIPARVVTADGTVLFTGQDIMDGQNVWQSTGGQQNGTVWGHGSYVAPDWSADFLHRECVWLLDHWGQADFGKPYAELDLEHQGALRARLKAEIRTNTHHPETGDIVVSAVRAQAIQAVRAHYETLYSDDPALGELREAYALPNNVLRDDDRRKLLSAFYFWAAWGSRNEPSGPDDDLHTELAAGAADRQPPDRLEYRVVGGQLCAVVGGHRRAGLVLCDIETRRARG